MRIRKNAKISSFLYTNTNLSNDSHQSLLHKNFCQLNQSPWDVITFPSSDSPSSLHQFDDYEVYYNVDPDGNGSLVDSPGAFESVASTKTLLEDENYNVIDTKNDYDEIKEENVFCGKIDEKGWQCGRVIKNGNTMCDHHLVDLQNKAVWTTKKKSKPSTGPTMGNRPRRTKKQPMTNLYEFYYYSGFGPSWGKERGSTSTSSDECVTTTTTTTTSSVTFDSNKIASGTEEEEGKRFEHETCEAGPTGMDLDCVDDDDEKRGKMGIIGKKRGRKPMKSRSLKSLM